MREWLAKRRLERGNDADKRRQNALKGLEKRGLGETTPPRRTWTNMGRNAMARWLKKNNSVEQAPPHEPMTASSSHANRNAAAARAKFLNSLESSAQLKSLESKKRRPSAAPPAAAANTTSAANAFSKKVDGMHKSLRQYNGSRPLTKQRLDEKMGAIKSTWHALSMGLSNDEREWIQGKMNSLEAAALNVADNMDRSNQLKKDIGNLAFNLAQLVSEDPARANSNELAEMRMRKTAMNKRIEATKGESKRVRKLTPNAANELTKLEEDRAAFNRKLQARAVMNISANNLSSVQNNAMRESLSKELEKERKRLLNAEREQQKRARRAEAARKRRALAKKRKQDEANATVPNVPMVPHKKRMLANYTPAAAAAPSAMNAEVAAPAVENVIEDINSNENDAGGGPSNPNPQPNARKPRPENAHKPEGKRARRENNNNRSRSLASSMSNF